MSGYVAAAAAALLTISCSARTAPVALPSGPPILTVVAWNTHAGLGNLQQLADDLQSGALTGHSGSECLLLLQEVTEGDVMAIAEPREWTTAFVPVRDNGDGARGNAVIFSGRLDSPRIVPLPRERQTRAAVLARIDLAGHELFVASVHLENRETWSKGGLLGDHARRSQADALLRALPRNLPGILGGDLNTWLGRGEPAWQALTRRFDDTPDWPRSPTFAARLVLDHVLMDLPAGWRASSRVLENDYGSDHRPVVAIMSGT